MKRPFCVALTGGVGSGKSRVAASFSRLGIDVVDTDAIARELTSTGSAVLTEIVKAFGADVLNPDGSLDRAELRTRIFSDPRQRKILEGLLHPRIRKLAAQQVESAKSDYVLLVVPLLVESDAYWDLADRVLVVDCDPAMQIDRVMRRDGLDRAAAEAMLSAQASRQERLSRADDVIRNQGTVEALDLEVSRLHLAYLKLAATSLSLH
jgi:dephospho-CoA kinase